jgi:hypothetical protein
MMPLSEKTFGNRYNSVIVNKNLPPGSKAGILQHDFSLTQFSKAGC